MAGILMCWAEDGEDKGGDVEVDDLYIRELAVTDLQGPSPSLHACSMAMPRVARETPSVTERTGTAPTDGLVAFAIVTPSRSETTMHVSFDSLWMVVSMIA